MCLNLPIYLQFLSRIIYFSSQILYVGSLFLTEVFIRILFSENQNPSDFICFKMTVLLLFLKIFPLATKFQTLGYQNDVLLTH